MRSPNRGLASPWGALVPRAGEGAVVPAGATNIKTDKGVGEESRGKEVEKDLPLGHILLTALKVNARLL
jgi:hypothetical protein